MTPLRVALTHRIITTCQPVAGIFRCAIACKGGAMRGLRNAGLTLLVMCSSAGPSASQTPPSPAHVVITSGDLKLHGLLWIPQGTGRFPAVLFNHGAERGDVQQASLIGPVFARHGYVFLYLFRRGHALSADQ